MAKFKFGGPVIIKGRMKIRLLLYQLIIPDNCLEDNMYCPPIFVR